MSEQQLRRIRVQQFCLNCESPISGLCLRCSKNKNRKPRVIEIYDAPHVYKFCPCKQSVWIKCAVEASVKPKSCKEFMWRSIMKDGTMRYKDHFCGYLCSNAGKRTGEEVSCSCGCGKMLWRKGFSLKTYKLAYVSNKHQWEHQRQLKKDKKKEKDGDLSHQYLWCENGCKDVTDHRQVKGNIYACMECGKNRNAAVQIGGLVHGIGKE